MLRLKARATREAVEFVIDDDGLSFDITTIPDPTHLANLAKASGRGLLLINAFMDDVPPPLPACASVYPMGSPQ
ncbi:MAG: ATP-binding protein [Planctomycetes bacterium]|nr:ATP-binding protein [Planctomycetota bacterium]